MTERELFERVEKLERNNRRMKRFAVATLVLAVALGTVYVTRPEPDVIKAREFDVIDSSRKVRVKMDVTYWKNQKGELLSAPGITLFDAKGKSRMAMTAEIPSSFMIWDAKGTPLVQLSSSFGEPTLYLAAPQGKAGVAVDVPPSGEPSINVTDAKGSVIWQTP